MVITYSPSLRDEDIWKPAASRQAANKPAVVNNSPIRGMMASDNGNAYAGDSWY